MIHIKETEIIPLLKEAQTEYSQKITEGDPKKCGDGRMYRGSTHTGDGHRVRLPEHGG